MSIEVKLIATAVAFVVVMLPLILWRARRTRDLLGELAARRAIGPNAVRAWIDVTFPAAPVVSAKTMRRARERFCALALANDYDTLDAELASVPGEGGWRVVALATGRFAQVVRGEHPDAAAVQLRTLAQEATAYKTAWIDPTAAITPLVELADAILAGHIMVRTGTLDRISMADPLFRIVIREGLAYTGKAATQPGRAAS
jgi:hypothetical protein